MIVGANSIRYRPQGQMNEQYIAAELRGFLVRIKGHYTYTLYSRKPGEEIPSLTRVNGEFKKLDKG